jgi:hypothetical protein
VSERQQGIYRKALDALDDFDNRAKLLTSSLLTSEQIEEIHITEPLEILQVCVADPATPLADSVATVHVQLLRTQAESLELLRGIPDAGEFARVFMQRTVDSQYRFMVRMVDRSIRQHAAVGKLVDQSKLVREILSSYRKGEIPK